MNDGSSIVKICYSDILCGGNGAKLVCPTVGVKKEIDVTIVTAPSSACCGFFITYGISITWKTSCSATTTENFEVIGSGDAGDTTTIIATALAASVNTNPSIPITATGVSAVVQLKADTAGIDFTVAISATQSGAMTQSVITANVDPAGHPADLIAMGVPSAAIDNAGTYSMLLLNYVQRVVDTTSMLPADNVVTKHCAIFIEVGAAQTAVLTANGGFEDILGGVTGGSSGLTLANYIAKQTTWCVPS